VNHKQSAAVFVQFTAKPSGSPISGLMVVDALREAGYEVHTVFAGMGELAEDYRRRCVTVRQPEGYLGRISNSILGRHLVSLHDLN